MSATKMRVALRCDALRRNRQVSRCAETPQPPAEVTAKRSTGWWVAGRTSSPQLNSRVASHRGARESPGLSCLPGLAAATHALLRLILFTPELEEFRLGVDGMDLFLPSRGTIAVSWEGKGMPGSARGLAVYSCLSGRPPSYL